jgi:hypothetical protein
MCHHVVDSNNHIHDTMYVCHTNYEFSFISFSTFLSFTLLFPLTGGYLLRYRKWLNYIQNVLRGMAAASELQGLRYMSLGVLLRCYVGEDQCTSIAAPYGA